MQLDYSLSTISSISRSRAHEIGTTAAEPTGQMNNGDHLGHLIVVLDLRQSFDHVRLGFVGHYLGPHYFVKQATISSRPHAPGFFGKRVADPDIDS